MSDGGVTGTGNIQIVEGICFHGIFFHDSHMFYPLKGPLATLWLSESY